MAFETFFDNYFYDIMPVRRRSSMLINREIDYAIRILRALADGENHPIKPLCEEEDIPWSFGYKILGKLRNAGYVKSVSGVHGGCTLTVDLHEVTVLDIFRILDDKPYINKCLGEGYICKWVVKKGHPCIVHRNLTVMQKELDQILGSYDLHSLIFVDQTAGEQQEL